MTTLPPVRLGIAALISHPTQPSKILLGQRLSAHGHGTYQFPGGHLDHGEDLLACAVRETKEETNLDVRGVRLVAVVNSIFRGEGRHYVTLFVLCECTDGGEGLVNREPEKCGGWEWVEWGSVCGWVREGREGAGRGEVRRLFLPIVELVEGRGHLIEFPFHVPGDGGSGTGSKAGATTGVGRT